MPCGVSTVQQLKLPAVTGTVERSEPISGSSSDGRRGGTITVHRCGKDEHETRALIGSNAKGKRHSLGKAGTVTFYPGQQDAGVACAEALMLHGSAGIADPVSIPAIWRSNYRTWFWDICQDQCRLTWLCSLHQHSIMTFFDTWTCAIL